MAKTTKLLIKMDLIIDDFKTIYTDFLDIAFNMLLARALLKILLQIMMV